MENENKIDTEKYLDEAYALANDAELYRSIDVSSAFERNRRKLRSIDRKQLFIQALYKVAAILLLPLLTTSLVMSYLYMEQKVDVVKEETLFAEIVAVPGTFTRFELPDYSKVWLNSGSSLRYPTQFTGKERNVRLTGEAFFEVEADSIHLFNVMTPAGMKVTARGTRFNVSAYEEEPVEACLEKGVIDVRINNKKVTLKPQEMAVYDKMTNQMHVLTVHLDEKTAWREGKLVYRNTRIEDVFKQLSRRFNVDIEMSGNADKDYRIRASFAGETITQIMDYLKQAAPIEWSMVEISQQSDTTFSRQRINVTFK